MPRQPRRRPPRGSFSGREGAQDLQAAASKTGKAGPAPVYGGQASRYEYLINTVLRDAAVVLDTS